MIYHLTYFIYSNEKSTNVVATTQSTQKYLLNSFSRNFGFCVQYSLCLQVPYPNILHLHTSI